jgi:hypothetical protein
LKLPLRSVAAALPLACLATLVTTAEAQPPFQLLPDRSVARNWSEALLFALRRDTGRVAYNARVVFQFSVAVYDAWAVHDADARPFLLGETVNTFDCPYVPSSPLESSPAAQRTTISYAAYRYLRHRFGQSANAAASFAVFDDVMRHYGLDPNDSSIDYLHDASPAALGNYIADCVIRLGLGDGSNEADGYRTRFYAPVNPPLDPTDPGSIKDLVDPDRWQKLALATFVNKTGQTLPAPDFETPEWGFTSPFAMTANDRRVFRRDGADYWVYYDPGKPALISATDPDALPEEYVWGFSLVAVWSGHLDPSRGHGAKLVDISPASLGHNATFPQTIAQLREFYDFLGGGDRSRGHAKNPATGRAYEPELVPLADYARTLVNFWADGPFTAETPAGSLMLILNEQVSDSPGFAKRIGGVGPVVDDLEWDVKSYFALSGGVHDAGVTTWSLKGWYDYARPITAIRYLGTVGQSSDPADPDCPYHPRGIAYVEDPSDPAGDGSRRVVDCVRPGDPLAAGGANVGKIKLLAWRGHPFVSNVNFDVAGVDWILAENWWPYQRANFVTPPFSGYTSGHSTLTSAGAQVLTLLTGSPYFPSGLFTFPVEANAFLDYERGPSVDVNLQWATYFDLADSAGISRLWAGVHPPVDDVTGRRIGRVIGARAFEKASRYFSGKRATGSGLLSSAPR